MRTALLLAALCFLAGCGHGHSSSQEKPEPRTGEYQEPYILPTANG